MQAERRLPRSLRSLAMIRKRTLVVPLAITLGAISVLFAFTPSALAQWTTPTASQKVNIIDLPWPNPAMRPLPPSFVLPEQNRWGCLACHSNPKLSKFRDGKEVSLFIDPNIIGKSMHRRIACLDCHTNFSYDEHPASTPQDFRKVAGLACMKCHPFQALLYKQSIHGQLALQNKLGRLAGQQAEPALCSSCHGFHDIRSPRFEPYRSKFRASAKRICGQCHTDRYQSFNDYYHGRAYKMGAKDAPACWDCHSNHRILKAADPDSTVNPNRLPRTCDKCHEQPTRAFTSYAKLIHGREEALEANPIMKIVRVFIPRAQKAQPEEEPAALRPVAPKEEGLLQRIFHVFFPKTLRPEAQL